jgi:predicted adenine nucleotide alpha hydrolase (AANH) superfamily ATPase
MESITIHPKSKEEIKAFEQMAKALNVPFEKSKYNPDFLAKIKRGEKDKKSGNFKVIKTEDLWK